MKKTTIKIMLVALCAHLLYSNSELLIAAKDMTIYPSTVFDKVVLTVFALSYSLISALCVFHVRKYLPVMVFALLDGFAVYLRINVDQEHFLLITSLFFGVYTFCLVSFCYAISKQNRNQNASKSESKTENGLPFFKAKTNQNESKSVNFKANQNENPQAKPNQTESKNEFCLIESETKTTIKQITSKLNPIKDERKRIEIIMAQPPELRSQLLCKYGYETAEPDATQQSLDF